MNVPARAAGSPPGVRRTRWTRSSIPSWYSCGTSTRTTTAALRPRARRPLAADRPVHRRHRPHDGAPPLFALLRQGDERHGAGRLSGAVRACFHQGLGAVGRIEDVDARQRRGPEALVATYGADAVRLYVLFMGPADQDMEWTPSGIEGIARFLRRLWRVVNEVATTTRHGAKARWRRAHATIAKVTDDIGRRLQFPRRSRR